MDLCCNNFLNVFRQKYLAHVELLLHLKHVHILTQAYPNQLNGYHTHCTGVTADTVEGDTSLFSLTHKMINI